MPMHVTVDQACRVVTTRGWGEISNADLGAAHDYFEAHPEIDRSFTRLCDLSAATSVSASEEAVAAWAADPISNPAVRHALVCSAPNVWKRALEFVAKSRSYFREVSAAFSSQLHTLARDSCFGRFKRAGHRPATGHFGVVQRATRIVLRRRLLAAAASLLRRYYTVVLPAAGGAFLHVISALAVSHKAAPSRFRSLVPNGFRLDALSVNGASAARICRESGR